MTKNKSPFITPPTLPDLFRTRANESTLLSMQPGEITWVVPWTIYNCAEHGFWTRVGIEQRGEEYGGTLNTKIVRDDEAFILDLTAADGGDLHGLCEPTSCMGEVNEHPVIFTGVLWPLLTVENGKYDPEVESYNLEQIAIHDQFSGYFETKYGNPYVLASTETYVSPDFDWTNSLGVRVGDGSWSTIVKTSEHHRSLTVKKDWNVPSRDAEECLKSVGKSKWALVRQGGYG